MKRVMILAKPRSMGKDMKMSSITIRPKLPTEFIAKMKRKLGFRRFKVYPETQAPLNRFREGEVSVCGDRRSGKTTALLLYAFELIETEGAESVAVLTFNARSLMHLADAWADIFPDQRSPLFTTNPMELRGIRNLALLIDETSRLQDAVRERLRPFRPNLRAEVWG